MKFKIGEPVRWASKVHNVTLNRKGQIAFVIDNFMSLSDVLNSEEFIDKFGKRVNIIYNKLEEFRMCESYLVVAKSRDGQVPTLYWPDTDALKIIRERKSNKKRGNNYESRKNRT